MYPSKKTVLSNGVRVITERHPGTPAVQVGFWLLSGTRDEPAGRAGVSHFLEHLVFKGTKKRNAYQIALSLEAVGGELNAFTTKEYTCFHTASLSEHLDLAVDVLADLVFDAELPAEEFQREKQVVLQEIRMAKEDYDEHIYDIFLREHFPRSALGTPILGTERSIEGMKRSDVSVYLKERYFSGNLIVTAAGGVEHDDFVRKLEDRLRRVRKTGKKASRVRPKSRTFSSEISCPSEQTHILMGFPTSSFKDSDRYESYFVSTLLGGGMTSKLYQVLREKTGLVYSVFSYLYTFSDSAVSFLYLATEKSSAAKAKDLVFKELEKLRKSGITKKDLELYRTQMRGHLLLSSDDLESRMLNLAHNEMIFGRQRSNEEIVFEIDRISRDSVEAYIEKHLHLDRVSHVVMGDLS